MLSYKIGNYIVEKYQKGISSIMKDFSPDPSPEYIWIPLPGSSKASSSRCLKEEIIDFEDEYKINQPFIIYLLFVDILKYKYSGISEKVAWEIPILYKGIPFILAHRKFGFQFISNKINIEIQNTANDAMVQINKAIPLVEKIIQPKVNQIMEDGNVTINNEYLTLRRRYKFFYKKTKKAFKNKFIERYNLKNIRDKSIDEIYAYLDEYYTFVEKKEYYLCATLDAFYSWLEFLLIAIYPFTNIEQKIELQLFISMSWKEKFKKIFDFDDKRIKLIYEDLIELKEQFRNPMAHGHYLKNKSLIHVHMPGLGAIPFHLTQNGKELEYSFKEINEENFDKISECLNKFENYIENSNDTTKLISKYLKNNLDLYFNYESRKEYRLACNSKEDMDYFIELTQKRVDDAMNMDW